MPPPPRGAPAGLSPSTSPRPITALARRRLSPSASSPGSTGRASPGACASSRRSARAPAPAGSEPAAEERATLAASWDSLLHRLPPDWSDLYAEVELDSSDFLDRGALLLAPINPARAAGHASFRFRAANRQGYGVAAGMARRAFQRLDDEGVSGRVRVLRVLSDTNAPFSQGPVWREDGRAV